MHDGAHRKLSNKGKNKNKPEQDRKVDYSKYNNPDSTMTVSKEEAKRAQIIGGALIAIIILLVAVIWGSVAFVQNKNAQKAEETKAVMTKVVAETIWEAEKMKVAEWTRIRLANHGIPKSIGVGQKPETGLVQGVFSRRTIASS